MFRTRRLDKFTNGAKIFAQMALSAKLKELRTERNWTQQEVANRSGLKQIVRRIATRANITGKKLGTHTFRHTFANNFLDSGGDPLDLKYLLGHASLKMVENYVRAHQEKRALKAHERFSPVDRLGIK